MQKITENIAKVPCKHNPLPSFEKTEINSYTFAPAARKLFAELAGVKVEEKAPEMERAQKKMGIVRQKKGHGRGCL